MGSTEKAMAPHSSTLAWNIPWTEEPGGLQSMGLQRVGHTEQLSLSVFSFLSIPPFIYLLISSTNTPLYLSCVGYQTYSDE